MLDLYANCVCLAMVEETYPAELAQLSYSFFPSETGVVVKVSGLNHKLALLLETIMEHAVDLESR